MPHETALIATMSVALALAFVFGFLATRLQLPSLVGYLLAGVVVGPFTPGFVADMSLAPQLAEIGVILLMFGVGIHFSLRDLLAVRSVAIPGAIFQSTIATVLAILVCLWWGWGLQAGLVLGLAISVASTVVLLRALMEGDLLETTPGRIAVGWLIVEDLLTVLALVLLPAMAGGDADHGHGLSLASMVTDWLGVTGGLASIAVTVALTLGKVVLLVAVMLFAGARVVPWLLIQVSRTGSRELFILAVLAVAFGIAFGSATIFGVSFALGAFLAGLVVGESDLSHQAAEDALPLRDAFAVLFFVSVGMLFDPSILWTSPLHVLAVVGIIVVAKPLAAFLLVVALRRPARTGLVVAAGLAQIGEFSFILAELGRSLGMLPTEGYGLVLAGAIVSITLNPAIFATVRPIERWLDRWSGRADAEPLAVAEPHVAPRRDHAVLCGYGRVGRLLSAALELEDVPLLVVDQDWGLIDELQARGVDALRADVADHGALKQMHLERARVLVVAMSDPLATRHVVEFAQKHAPGLPIVARTHSEAERQYLTQQGVDAILGEQELALAMNRQALELLGCAVPLERRPAIGSGEPLSEGAAAGAA
ncbi:MAG: cation:proton antiporter [Chloroflexi bacterium]|nr:cation:proton antiporter [Chloroflexota bacterium]